MYSAQWWAHLVGALRVHPHKHDANYPPQKDRGFARGGRVEVDPTSLPITRLNNVGLI